ncbi:MAG: 23S rRNA (adenine(2503)-C(2))-methyltransferase RlmN [Clostridia bacterium]|jgi:23S rRNA (adenine2503-C2)-methyltransferase|nr:23S rRNA (adenine(2503)-C(2))-methyltransferase RlmN [Clostridia bacterium]
MVNGESVKFDIRGMLPEELRELLHEAGEKPYRAAQVFGWIQDKAVQSFSEMKNAGDKVSDFLAKRTQLQPLKLVRERISSDGTRKYLWALQDKSLIETVLMRHGGDKTRNRNTLCLSTQVGCGMGCSFCATGTLGFIRNLEAGEIVAQVLDVTRQRAAEEEGFKVHNLVYMGMGEPLLNLSAVLKSIKILNNSAGQNIGIRRITVSTCGLAPQIEQLAEEELDIVLAVSLHAPTNDLRDRMMPVNRRYPLERLLAACRRYIEKTGRRVTFEYALIKGLNDSPAQAKELAALLAGLKANVNLIPINTHANNTFKRPHPAGVQGFLRLLQNQGLHAVIREEKGGDIEAACGQLAGKER